MALTVTNQPDAGSGGGDFKDVEVGSHVAVIVGVLDCGFQKPYQDKQEDRATHQCAIVYEVDEKTEDGKFRLTITETYNVTLRSTKAKLRGPVLAAFPGIKPAEALDLGTLVGKSVLITVEEKANGKRKVAQVAPLAKGMSGHKGWEEVTEPFGLAKYLMDKAIGAEDAKVWNDRAKKLRENADSDDIPF